MTTVHIGDDQVGVLFRGTIQDIQQQVLHQSVAIGSMVSMKPITVIEITVTDVECDDLTALAEHVGKPTTFIAFDEKEP